MTVEVVTESLTDLQTELGESAAVLTAQIDTAVLVKLGKHVLTKLYVDQATEAAISFVSAARMEELHLEWMELPGATDVMSFPMDELTPGSSEQLSGPGMLGDVVVCLEVAAEQAAAAEHTLQDEVQLLVTHSLLHLLGFDHDNPVAEAEMFGLQRELLAEFNASEQGQ